MSNDGGVGFVKFVLDVDNEGSVGNGWYAFALLHGAPAPTLVAVCCSTRFENELFEDELVTLALRLFKEATDGGRGNTFG
tara:strand:+ start:425 stop:664 length:240 start_codon:yes stop_codon:yes gene_type:complete